MIHKLNEGAQCAVSRAVSTRPSQYQGAEEVSFPGTTESGRCVNLFSIRGQTMPTPIQLIPPSPRDFQTFQWHCHGIGLRRLNFLSYVVLCALHLLLYYITVKRRTSCQESRQKDFRRWTRNTMHCSFFSLLHPSLLAIYCYTICQKKENEKKKLSVVILQQYCPNHKVRLNHFLFYEYLIICPYFVCNFDTLSIVDVIYGQLLSASWWS